MKVYVVFRWFTQYEGYSDIELVTTDKSKAESKYQELVAKGYYEPVIEEHFVLN